MSTDVIPAEPVAAPEPSIATEHDYSAYLGTFTREEHAEWARTGEEPTGKQFKDFNKPVTPIPPEPETKTPEPVKAESEPEPGTGDDDEHPEYFGTPEQIKAQRTAFTRLRREKAELKAELKLLKEQKAEKSTPAPAAVPKTESVADPDEPELPNIADFTDVADYHAAMKKFHKELRAYDQGLLRKQIEAERHEQAVSTERRSQANQWSQEIKAGKEAHADFEKVAFSASTPASLAMLGVIMSMKGGAEVFYQLGKHPDIATALAQETDIPGNYQTYSELMEAAENDSRLARRLGVAEGIVRTEAKRLLDGKKDAPKPITKTAAPTPGTRVNASASATGDPIEDAYARGDFAQGAKLEAARDVESRKRR
jgi:hypothetical protein